MMVDGVIAALAINGHDTLPVIVAETGWPSSGGSEGISSGALPAETEAGMAYAEMYLKGLISHLKTGLGTPLRKEGLAGVYIYQLFDEEDLQSRNSSSTKQCWGILFRNMTTKYKIDEFSVSETGSDCNGGSRTLKMDSMLFLLVIASTLLLLV